MKHLDSVADALAHLDEATDAFLATATPQQIHEQMAYLHGCSDEDVPSLRCGRWEERMQMVTSCPVCKQFALEWSAFIHGARPELKAACAQNNA